MRFPFSLCVSVCGRKRIQENRQNYAVAASRLQRYFGGFSLVAAVERKRKEHILLKYSF